MTLVLRLNHDPRISRVLYPGIKDHPQYTLANQQMTGGGTIITFEVRGGKKQAFGLLRNLKLIDISNKKIEILCKK